ncbi:MAG: heavy metal translocating P-type ATPase [Microbacteriaceae bacterium]
MNEEMNHHEHEQHCEAHGANAPMCSCSHNPGGECHCPPNECKCDQQHHLIGETQVGHNCCATGGEHDHSGHEGHEGHEHNGHEGHDHSGHAGHDHSGHAGHDHSGHAGHAGHDHSHHDPGMFKKQFWFAFALTAPAIYFSHTVQMLLGYVAISFPYSQYIPAVAGLILFFTGGRVFLTTGWQEIRAKQPGMMALIAMALVVALGYSAVLTTFELLGTPLNGMDFWWELASLITIMLLGHWIEMSSIMRAQNSMDNLVALLPKNAEVLVNGEPQLLALSSLKVGDVVLVRPGSSVPADGIIVQGGSYLNEAMVTGESQEVYKSEGEQVIAGTINSSQSREGLGALTIRVTAVGGDTLVSGIMRLVADAQQSKSKSQVLADRAASWLFYIALVAAALTAGIWTLLGTEPTDFVLERVVTVLVIACPHALGLAIPLVTAITTAKAARSGLLIRNRIDFEKARSTHVVLFDKTGTLTTGKRNLVSVTLAQGSTWGSTDDLLALAAAVEFKSEHVLARSIVQQAQARSLTLPNVSGFSALGGLGVRAELDGREVLIGGPAMLTQNGVSVGVTDLNQAALANEKGNTVVFVIVDKSLEGYIELGDQIRESSKQAVYELQRRRIRVAMVTGDATGVANAVARELGIEEVFAEVSPAGKNELVKRLQSDGSVVAFVGDGINDAPALALADVGISVGGGTDVAMESSGLVLLNDDPIAVSGVIDLSKRSVSKMRQNLVWAAGYNALAIPLAAGALMPFGFVLSPALGAVLMSLSTIIVAANAQLLRR